MLVIVRTLSLFTSQPRNVHSIHTIHMYRMHLTIITYVLTHVQLFRYTRTHVGTNYVVRTLLVSHTRDKIHNRSDHGAFLQNNSISRIEVLKNTYVRTYVCILLRNCARIGVTLSKQKVFYLFSTRPLLGANVLMVRGNWRMSLFLNARVRTYIRTYVYIYVRIYIFTHICTYVRTFVSTYVYIYTYVRTYVHVYCQFNRL